MLLQPSPIPFKHPPFLTTSAPLPALPSIPVRCAILPPSTPPPLLTPAANGTAVAPQEEYLDVAVPVLGATLRALEAEHRQGPANEQDAKLAKRLKYLGGRRDVGGAAAGDAGGEARSFRAGSIGWAVHSACCGHGACVLCAAPPCAQSAALPPVNHQTWVDPALVSICPAGLYCLCVPQVSLWGTSGTIAASSTCASWMSGHSRSWRRRRRRAAR